MSEGAAGLSVTHIDADEAWEPDEENGGLFRMVWQSDAVMVGLWKPGEVAGTRIEYRLDADETLVVLEGSGELRVDQGEPIQLRPGVVVLLPSGSELSWLLEDDFRELWIYS
jgi:uncharacterized cupin superfamily protein